MGVTDVLRGEDHVSNTATQIQMFTALGAKPPRFAHEALLVGREGKLSKRLGSLGCDAFRERGVDYMNFVHMALMGGLGIEHESLMNDAKLCNRILAEAKQVTPTVARDFGETHNDLLYFLATYGVLSMARRLARLGVVVSRQWVPALAGVAGGIVVARAFDGVGTGRAGASAPFGDPCAAGRGVAVAHG